MVSPGGDAYVSLAPVNGVRPAPSVWAFLRMLSRLCIAFPLEGARSGNTVRYLRAAFLERVGQRQVNEDLSWWRCHSDRCEGRADLFLVLTEAMSGRPIQ